ncbi:hypothetical protein KC356_g328 [Hortaea werneckii]|nr:hypothetical protein KC356_g328 [Hortaea werneckii]
MPHLDVTWLVLASTVEAVPGMESCICIYSTRVPIKNDRPVLRDASGPARKSISSILIYSVHIITKALGLLTARVQDAIPKRQLEPRRPIGALREAFSGYREAGPTYMCGVHYPLHPSIRPALRQATLSNPEGVNDESLYLRSPAPYRSSAPDLQRPHQNLTSITSERECRALDLAY